MEIKAGTLVSGRDSVEVASFELGAFAVTFDEYDQYTDALRLPRVSDEGWGRGDRPVINVSWHDAMAYCKWAGKRDGCKYRLPTEDQWEYACRAGTATKYFWGDDATLASEYSIVSAGKTEPVGSKKPNPWGLFDMTGNVWEWGKSKSRDGDIGLRLVRERETARVVCGDSWINSPYVGCVTNHINLTPDYRSSNVGFRLVRETKPKSSEPC